MDGWDAAKWRLGPFAVTPRVELKNLGWDSNVFNQTEDPKSDFTATVAAPVDWWLRLGSARLHGTDNFEGVYFAKYSDQGGFNQKHELTFLVPLNRIRPYVGGSYLSTNDRPGYEINARVRHTEAGGRVGAIIRLTSKLDLDVSGRQLTYRYDDGEENNYSEVLNRRTENYGAQLRYRLSSLTTLTPLADAVREWYDVQAGGLTSRQFEAELKKKLADGYFKDRPGERRGRDLPQPEHLHRRRGTQPRHARTHAKQGAYRNRRAVRIDNVRGRSGAIVVHAPTRTQAEGPILPGQREGAPDSQRVNLRDRQSGVLSRNIALRDGDTNFVRRAESIYVFGRVRNPGAFTLQTPRGLY